MHHPKVNIIILNWNGWEDTIDCVKSLQKTDCTKPHKIIIIDNGSTDDSVIHIEETFPGIELIQNDSNLGFGGGCNTGLLRSMTDNAEFAWLLNNDTTVYENSLQEMLDTAESSPRAGLIGSVLYYMKNTESIQTWGGGYISFWTGMAKHIHDRKDAHKLQYITGASMLIRIKALREVGMFDDVSYFMYWEDTDLCYRFAKKGWGIAVAERSKILHKESASLKNNNYLLVRYFNQSAVMFFCKFYRFCIIPVIVGLSGRLIKRIIYRDSSGAKEILLIYRHKFTNTLLRLFK